MMSDNEITAVFVFSRKTLFLKEILPNVSDDEELKALQQAVQRLLKPETATWISRIFKR